ncbi:MAG: PSD1 and planctomycete cytochrome C domain-containing protein [Verrucomicrobiota bacterium]
MTSLNRTILFISAVLPSQAHAAISQDLIQFNRDIRPILSDNCYYCHGFDPKNRKADLRLDTFEGATEVHDGAKAIEPGDITKSALWLRINSSDVDEIMPPPKAHKTISAAQKETIKRWIQQGAPYEKHWAFQPIRHENPPIVQKHDWPRNPVDSFVLARIEKEGLTPSPPASKATLLRRLALDLTGLAPSPDQSTTYLTDSSPLATERLIDQLLASPHYGERMAVDWLDAARYADSNGYQVDRDREMWPWRDWVVNAFNENKPFDQFTIEQIAGDLLPNATLQQKLATGFNRNHMINEEGGIIPEEFLAEYTADRVETTAAVWLGQTFNCCRCHDHKFDPFTQRDFYSLKAFFHNVPEQGIGRRSSKSNASSPPILAVPAPELDAKQADLKQQKAALEGKRAKLAAVQRPGFEAWIEKLKTHQVQWSLLPATFAQSDRLTVAVEDGLTRVGREIGDGLWNVTIQTPVPTSKITALRLIATPIGETSTFRWNRFSVSAGSPESSHKVELQPKAYGDAHTPASLIRLLEPDNIEALGLTAQAKKPGSAVFLIRPTELLQTTGSLTFELGARANTDLIHLRIEATSAEEDLLVPLNILQLASKPADERSEKETATLLEAFKSLAPEIESINSELLLTERRLAKVIDAYPASMVMAEMDKPRDTFVLNRGQYDKPGDRVTANTPAVLPAMNDSLPRNRLGLAKWLVSPENPLPARVIVNRLWQQVFGVGLVKTSEDFGSQGQPPSHPELLDWLANEFIQSGWDIKHMIRLMVTSATYQQQSVLSPTLKERDPENRFLARGARFRLMGEFVRDQALSVSGLLAPTLGGPPVRPYHPVGLYEQMVPTSPDTVKTYHQDHGEALYRRSLYTYWKRSIPHPAMLSFGTPFREVCTIQRPRSNTPLQALNLMNDETYIEAARFLAERMISEGGPALQDRLQKGIQLVLTRHASPKEMAILERAYQRAFEDFSAHPEAAAALLRVGERPHNPALKRTELAALTTVANTLLCLDETVTKQ